MLPAGFVLTKTLKGDILKLFLRCLMLFSLWFPTVTHGELGSFHGFGMSLRDTIDGELRARIAAADIVAVPDPIGFLRIANRKKIQIKSLSLEIRSLRDLGNIIFQVSEYFSKRRLPIDVNGFEVKCLSNSRIIITAQRLRLLRGGEIIIDGECTLYIRNQRLGFKKGILHQEKSGKMTLQYRDPHSKADELISVDLNP